MKGSVEPVHSIGVEVRICNDVQALPKWEQAACQKHQLRGPESGPNEIRVF